MTVELLGPSGVGKSTILRVAEAARPENKPWLGPDEATALVNELRHSRGREFRRLALDDTEIRLFVEACLDMVHGLEATPSHKVGALSMLRDAAAARRAVALLELPVPLVHDELILHRAFSILPQTRHVEDDALRFFSTAPLPEAAVVMSVDPDTLRARIAERGTLPNCYSGLHGPTLERAILTVLRTAEIAVTTLRERGIPVLALDVSADVHDSATALDSFVTGLSKGTENMADTTGSHESDDDIRDRLLAASGSFRKKAGRHELRTRDVMYCAFSTPGFSVSKDEAQRDAARRYERFGLTAEMARGKTALDLGANAGAMLFELSNLGIASGKGIEYDQDKMTLAAEIASHSQLGQLTFEQGDIDELDADKLGTYDIVLALAIEAHVQKPDRLYQLLGKVTGSTLLFEGNGNCDVEAATGHLKAAGFDTVEYRGFCDDDRDPRNNKRPMLVATKAPKRRSLFSRR